MKTCFHTIKLECEAQYGKQVSVHVKYFVPFKMQQGPWQQSVWTNDRFLCLCEFVCNLKTALRDTGSNRCKEQSWHQSFRSLAPNQCEPDSFPPCLAAWFRGWRKAAAAAGHESLRGHWVPFWDGHWVSEVHCPSHKGHPSCQTTLTQLSRGQPCKFSLRAWINCTRLALQINLVSGTISTLITQGLRGRTLVLLGLWPLPNTFSFLLPLLLRDSPVYTPRVGPRRVLWSVLPFLTVLPRIHHVLLISYGQVPILGGWHCAEPEIQQTGAPPLETRGARRGSFLNNVALCHSALTTGLFF